MLLKLCQTSIFLKTAYIVELSSWNFEIKHLKNGHGFKKKSG